MPARQSPRDSNIIKLPQWSIDALEGKGCDQCAYKDRLISTLCNALKGHVEHPNWTAEEWLEWAEGHTDY
jgi:hypothetical protein